MSSKYLGEKFDIHGGGMDLKFPHHECEIAQGQAANGTSPVNHWMHANMLTLNGKKMAKSTGNNILPEEIFSGNNDVLSKAYSPSVTRFFMLQANYRSILDFSDQALGAAEKGFYRLMDTIQNLNKLTASDKSTGSFSVKDWQSKCYAAMNDDFNSPMLIAHLFEAVKEIQAAVDGKLQFSKDDLSLLQESLEAFVFSILGLEKEQKAATSGTENEKLSGVVKLLIAYRNQARANKNFDLSDKIRNELEQLGITIKDQKEGTSFSL